MVSCGRASASVPLRFRGGVDFAAQLYYHYLLLYGYELGLKHHKCLKHVHVGERDWPLIGPTIRSMQNLFSALKRLIPHYQCNLAPRLLLVSTSY